MLSLYRASVPVFIRGFENLSALLVKGHAMSWLRAGIPPG
jgi:hypothetical protein